MEELRPEAAIMERQLGWRPNLQGAGFGDAVDLSPLSPSGGGVMVPLIEEEVHGIVPQVPEHVMAGRWVLLLRGAWSRSEAIHLLEARVALWSLRRVSRGSYAHGTFLVTLGDNLAEVLSFSKGRASDHGLRVLCCRAAAICLGCNLQWGRRYIETSRNVADRDSRAADRGEILAGESQVLNTRFLPTDTPACRPVVLSLDLLVPRTEHRPTTLALDELVPASTVALSLDLLVAPPGLGELLAADKDSIREETGWQAYPL